MTLKDRLSHNPGYSVQFEERAERAMSLITSGGVNCVVFNFESFGESQARLVQGIKDVTKVFQILIFADTTEPQVMQQVKGAPGIIVIEKPLLKLDRDISGLCERLIGGEQVFQREHVRHETRQKARIEFLDSGKVHDAVVTDVSVRGACVELAAGAVETGSRVKLTIDLDQLGRKRIVVAEIRWAKSAPGKSIIGVMFLND